LQSCCTAQNPSPWAPDGCKNSAAAGGGRLQASGKVLSLAAQASLRVSGAPARRSGPSASQSSCPGQNPAPWAPDGYKNSAAAGGGGLQALGKV